MIDSTEGTWISEHGWCFACRLDYPDRSPFVQLDTFNSTRSDGDRCFVRMVQEQVGMFGFDFERIVLV